MKKIGFLFPLLFVLMVALISPRVLSGAMSPMSMVFLGGGLILLTMLVRPKKAATRSAQAVAEEILDDYCADAFPPDQELGKKFYAALNDIGSNMPKSAVGKLQKLEPLCQTNQQRYALAVAAAHAWKAQQKFKDALREYNKAIVLNPTGKLAAAIGDCNQRLGNLAKARDSYEFACELEPENAKYVSSLATVHVAEGNYDTALDTALDALELEETLSQALATCAICYGLQNNSAMRNHYTRLAVNNGYKEEKINETIKALKK